MEMTSYDGLIAQFTDAQRRRAQALTEGVEVPFDQNGPNSFATIVRDERDCHVELNIDEGELSFGCDCDEFAKSNPVPCVHILAAIMVAADDGWLDLEESGPLTPLIESAPFSAEKDRDQPGGRYWKGAIKRLRQDSLEANGTAKSAWEQGRELIFSIDVNGSRGGDGVVIETLHRDRKRDGTWGKLHPSAISRRIAESMPNAADRQIAALLIGANAGGYYYDGYSSAMRHLLSPAMAQFLIPLICRTGRCLYDDQISGQRLPGIQWDDQGQWQLQLTLDADMAAGDYVLSGQLRRGEERLALSDTRIVTHGGLVFQKDRVAPLEDSGAFEWIKLLTEQHALRVPRDEANDLVAELNRMTRLPALTLPPELEIQETQPTMRPRLRLRAPGRKSWGGDDRLHGELSFDYEGTIAPEGDFSRGIFDAQGRRVILRDSIGEIAARDRLRQLGFRFDPDPETGHPTPRLATKNLPKAVKALLQENWHVEADGKLYRRAGNFQVDVTSGIDWFDLSARVDFDGQVVTLPTLLAAMRRGENTVSLGDGTFGLLPEEWLAKYAALASVAKPEDDLLRFTRSQIGLLDALLATHPQSTFDDTFRRTRDELRAFEGIGPADPPPGFIGELRPYQRETLGWFDFLRRFNFGGCLADDMGLGKTVQVLALLESRRTRDRAGADRAGPSLVVVPRSLVFNWLQEAARFTPQLRVFDHSGADRPKGADHLADYDLIVTTYGTLRRDIIHLKDVLFDYVVLDEAQTIKNPNSESAKSARLLSASHRLVLSGTPVQNHLGDLWSLFEFLNPGMLGAVSAFSAATISGNGADAEGRGLLARGLRPFILRRTKEQVATDLPARLEQTIYCELEPPQRKLYDELREHYRHSLLGLIEREGINKAKIQILEALLRLRQAACHPGLVDKARGDDPSAKLDMLLPRLAEVTEDGHKALVFSQFTQFLALVRKRLDRDKICYEYLDGRTRDRQERVNRFQSDPDCKLFLISLKAGGLGLNLTAADYVFLLDPWWNPAVEAQAIDRSHRIGQTRQVFACRLIARGTVEEKVLALQQSKRALADAIINADNSLIRTIGREDLSLLLS
jgi:superfamily II DNA or RNA helicase